MNHFYATLPDEAHKRTPMPEKCANAWCHNFALREGFCLTCYDREIDWLDTKFCYQQAQAKAKRRAEMRARFFAHLWNFAKLAAGVSLYLACVVGLLYLGWARW